MNVCRIPVVVAVVALLPSPLCLAQGFPGGPGSPPGMGMGPRPEMGLPPGIHSPELARKVEKILALRRIASLGLNRRDIEAALPILKRMAAAEQTLQDQAGRILDEEYRALLAADAASLPPAESGPRLGQLLARYNEQQAAQWGALAQSIGPQKAQGLRMMVEGPGPGFGMMPGMMPAVPGQPGMWPAGPPPGPGAPGPGAPGQNPPPSMQPGPPPDGAGPYQPQFGPNGPGNQFGGFQRPGRPGPPNMQMQPGGPFPGQLPMFGVHIGLQELVDLLQAKLGAMKG